MTEKTKKHPIRRAVLIILLILVIGLVLVGIWQRNNIKALWMVLNTDQQAIAEKQEQLKENRQEILNKYEIGDISEYIPETEGDLDVQEFLNGVGQASTETATVSSTPAQDTSSPAQNTSSGLSEEEAARSKQAVQQCVAALYTLEDQYVGKLNSIVEETKSEYRALPREERTRDNKLALVQSKLDVLLAAEKQCDSEVELLLQRIQQELDIQGSSDDLVSEIRQAYEDSKATWKAACLTELYG